MLRDANVVDEPPGLGGQDRRAVRGEGGRIFPAFGRINSRLRDIVAGGADFYRIHADVERQRRRWQANDRRADLLLSRGLPLAEAESILERYGDEVGLQDARLYSCLTRPGRARSDVHRCGRRGVHSHRIDDGGSS